MTRRDAQRPEARAPRGFRDRLGPELAAEHSLIAAIRPVFEAYGFEPLETATIEYADAIGAFLPDQDRPNAGVFSLQDDDERWLALRYDLTAPLARFVAERFDRLPKPFRRYQTGLVFRNEKPGPGRFREFTQFDADTVGSASMAADAEMALLAADALEAAGVARGDYRIRINHRGALDGALAAAGVDLSDDGARLTALRALDKFDRLGDEGVRALLGDGREDESGDFTKGAGLSAAQIDHLMAFLTLPSSESQAVLGPLKSLVGASTQGAHGVADLERVAALLDALGAGSDRVTIDPSVVRGLEYYTGPVLEAEILWEVQDEKGRPQRLGSVGGGGRYDGLVGRFREGDVPATGFSVGVSRLAAALEARRQGAEARRGPVVILVLDQEHAARSFAMAAELRAAGIRAEAYLGGSGMRAQMKYADKRGAPAVVIEGEDERAQGMVTIKDLALGEKLSKSIADNREWREARPAQQTAPRRQLVPAVRAIVDGADA